MGMPIGTVTPKGENMHHFSRFFFICCFIACCGWMSFATYQGVPQRDLASVRYDFQSADAPLKAQFYYSPAYKY